MDQQLETRVTNRRIPLEILPACLSDGARPLAQGVVTEISETGARLVADQLVASGSVVRLVIRRSPTERWEADVFVAWSTDGMEPNAVMVGAIHGLQFTDLADSDRERMTSFLERDAMPVASPGLRPRFEDLSDPDIEDLVKPDVESADNPFEKLRRDLLPDLLRASSATSEKSPPRRLLPPWGLSRRSFRER
jgi:hypothetical protein